MNTIFKRTAGVFLALLAAASLLVSFYFLVQVWRLRPPVTNTMRSGLEVISGTLQTTAEGLAIADKALQTAQTSIQALEGAVGAVGTSIKDSAAFMQAITGVVAEQIPKTLDAVQGAMSIAEKSAAVIDSVLRFLTILTPDAYNPPVPLDRALGSVSLSLDELPPSLTNMQTSLENTQSNLQAIQTQMDEITASIAEMEASLGESQALIQDYRRSVADMHATVRRLHARIETITIILAAFTTFVLLWLVVAQVGILLQGLEMLGVEGWRVAG
jgi:peptidoglycan hydrolase CwlO-like protein